jgi:hypothetical protein
VSYLNIENRLQYALQGFSMDFFYYGNNPYLYDPAYAQFVDRDSPNPCRASAAPRRS